MQMVLQSGDHSSPCYCPLQVTSTDIASAAKPGGSKCQICPVPVIWRLGELGDAEATLTLKIVFCFEAQMLLSSAYTKPMVFNQGKVPLHVGIYLPSALLTCCPYSSHLYIEIS